MGTKYPNISKPLLFPWTIIQLRRIPCKHFRKHVLHWWVILPCVSHTISWFVVRWFHSTSNQSSPHFMVFSLNSFFVGANLKIPANIFNIWRNLRPNPSTQVVGPPGTPYAHVPFFFDLAMSAQCRVGTGGPELHCNNFHTQWLNCLKLWNP